MKEFYIYGELAKVCGANKFTFNITTPQQAALLLVANFPAARKVILDNEWNIIRGDKDSGWSMGADHMTFETGDAPIHMMPAVVGSGGGGGAKAVIGAIVLTVAIVASGGTLAAPLAGLSGAAFTAGGLAVSYGSIALLGTAIALGGISQMLSPVPNVGDYGDREASASFLFNGAENAIEQGGPVPVVYGEFRVGSTVISSALDIEEVPF